jgi:hypothetical protein
MRILLIAALLIALTSHRAIAGLPNTVAVAIDTDSLMPKVAAEVQDGIVAHVLTGLTEVMSSLAATNLTLTSVSEAKTLERILDCDGADCLQDVAQYAKVDLVIQIRVHAKQADKKATKRLKQDALVSMVIARALPNRDAWTERTDCRACEARRSSIPLPCSRPPSLSASESSRHLLPRWQKLRR